MRKSLRVLLLAIGLVLSGGANAFGVGTPTTFSKLIWTASFNAAGITGCNQLIFDATGDLVNSDTLVIAGALNCGTVGFGMTGSVYLAIDGSLNITMNAATYTFYCPRVVGWLGACNIVDASGLLRGTGTIRLL